MIFTTTPAQTVGPYFTIGMPWDDGPFSVPRGSEGSITVSGTVFDGAGAPIPDALIETWQADSEGRFSDLHGHGGSPETDGFRGFARAATDDDGHFWIVTVKPGPVPWPAGGMQAPHIGVSVFARGMLHRCITRIYFADEAQTNGSDPQLARVPADRRATLLAEPTDDGYRFDIRLQGPNETVFFDV
jgi:protocatechuate 3,4-dioxygenase alpha subunit